jgi:hypothetical protein
LESPEGWLQLTKILIFFISGMKWKESGQIIFTSECTAPSSEIHTLPNSNPALMLPGNYWQRELVLYLNIGTSYRRFRMVFVLFLEIYTQGFETK